ncbi:MAG: hypothetical protein IPH76_18020 [Xanthomonadales bacterium]|nr:hypothetical protein [Xanthomonadales bacterium]
MTLDERLAAASTVFYAKTESAVRVRGADSDQLVVSTLDRIYLKGSKAVEKATTPYSGAECGASVRVPGLYYFLLDQSGRFDKCGTLIEADSVEARPLNRRMIVELKRLRRSEVQMLRERK